MSYSLRGKRISDSYKSLVQIISDKLYDGCGNLIDIDALGATGETNSKIFSITLSELHNKVNSNLLYTGGTYIVSGADSALYGGTTIVLKAVSNNKLELQGHGIFYNPIYDTFSNNYGIWSNYMYANFFSGIYSNFSFDELIYGDNDSVGKYVCYNVIEYVSGDWSETTTVIGDDSGYTASVSGFANPTYDENDIVIWGGYVWKNLNGNVGTKVSKYALDSEWEKINYDSEHYDIVADVIHYDYANDRIIYRKDKLNNEVSMSDEAYRDLMVNDNDGNSIRDFQWGNSPNSIDHDEYGEGVHHNTVSNSYCEIINFSGFNFVNNIITDRSSIKNSIFLKLGAFSYNTLKVQSHVQYVRGQGTISNNKFYNAGLSTIETTEDCSINENEIVGATMYYLHLYGTSTMLFNNMNINSSFSNCVLYDSVLDYNRLEFSAISNINMNSGEISKNYLKTSSFNNLTVDSSYIINNVLFPSSNSTELSTCNLTINANINNNRIAGKIYNCTITDDSTMNDNVIDGIVSNIIMYNGSNFDNNTLSSGSSIINNDLDDGTINGNIVNSQSSIVNNQLSNISSISYNTIGASSSLSYNILDNSSIIRNLISGSKLTFTGATAISSKTIKYASVIGASVSTDCSGATAVFTSYSKNIFSNSTGTSKLSYINNSDTFVIVNVNG